LRLNKYTNLIYISFHDRSLWPFLINSLIFFKTWNAAKKVEKFGGVNFVKVGKN